MPDMLIQVSGMRGEKGKTGDDDTHPLESYASLG